MNVENLNGYANQFVINDGDKVAFQSYKSLIAEYNRTTGKLKVYSDWDYSKTTLRHFKAFINEETGFHYENKAQWVKEMATNSDIEKVI